ncbi:MAG: amidohydrolase family protein [Spirochaetales bacterium]|nr:amidohydrolase family protein [Spirochaetales bacterium]
MKALIRNVRLIMPDRVMDDAHLVIRDGLIDDFGTGAYPKGEFTGIIDGKGAYLSPGFVDTHVHGGGGASFHDGTEEAIRTVLDVHLKGGTTSILPTLTSLTHERYLQVLPLFSDLDDVGPEIEGIHMEGPYCSGSVVGAQDVKTYRTVDYREVEAYLAICPKIRKWTAACEKEGGMGFGRFLDRKGIVASIGHSDATLEETLEAYDNGYRHVTHLYSSCSSYHREGAYRKAGIVEAAFLIDGMDVEAIGDGVHLPKEFLQLIYKIKGPEHICLVTDATRWGGANLPDGTKTFSDVEEKHVVFIENGVALVEDGSCFAGSIATADRLVRTVTKIAGIPLVDAVRMATLTPARTIGIDRYVGSIARGKRANLLLFDDDIDIEGVFVRGRRVV